SLPPAGASRRSSPRSWRAARWVLTRGSSTDARGVVAHDRNRRKDGKDAEKTPPVGKGGRRKAESDATVGTAGSCRTPHFALRLPPFAFCPSPSAFRLPPFPTGGVFSASFLSFRRFQAARNRTAQGDQVTNDGARGSGRFGRGTRGRRQQARSRHRLLEGGGG